MKHLGVLLLIPLTRVSPSQGYPGQQHANSSTHLHTYCSFKERQSGAKFLAKENNTMARLVSTPTYRLKVWGFNNLPGTILCLGQVWGEKGTGVFSPFKIKIRICKFYWWVESLWLLLHKFWSHFGIFGVKYHNEKSHFQTFQHVVLACIHYREGYTK